MSQNFQESEQCQEAEKFVPNWLVEVLEWISRFEMANSALSTSCRAFKQLCWPKLHQNVMPKRIVPYLQFSYALTGFTDDDFGIVLYRQPQNCWHFSPMIRIDSVVAPPEYIGGFEKIIFNVHEDERVLNFVSNIRHRLQSIYLKINNFWVFNGNEEKCAFYRQLLAMLSNKISILKMANYIEFDRNFPGIIDAAQTIQNEGYYCVSENEELCDFFIQWLLKKRSDGKQKRLVLGNRSSSYYEDPFCTFIGRIKKEFFRSNLATNFCVMLPNNNNYRTRAQMFTMENDATGEILELYHPFGHFGYYLIRHPRGEQEFWRQQAENAELVANTMMTEFILNTS